MKRRTLLAGGAALVAAPLHAPRAQEPLAAMPAMAPLLAARVLNEGVGYVSAQVERGGQPRFAVAGRLNLQAIDAPDADTRFEIGSITKTFTALLLADLVVRGELKLDDPVEALLPSGLKLRDVAGEPLRLVDLAIHRSGLPRLPANLAPASMADPYADYTEALLWGELAAWQPALLRGARFEYSNLGVGLLGEVLARRLKTDYASALRQRVLLPLGLGSMVLRAPGTRVEPAAQGHDARRRQVPPWSLAVLAGAGALNGSAREMARYAQCALGLIEHPLTPAFELTFKKHGSGPNGSADIGLAWLLATVDGRRLINHDGATAGMSASMWLDPAAGRGAVVLANAAVAVQDLALHALDGRSRLRDVAAEAAAQKAATERIAAAVPPAAMEPLAGTYALTPQFKVVIRFRDGRLFAQATGQGEFELFAAELGEPAAAARARVWFARVAPIEIGFAGSEGVPAEFELRQSGQRLRFVRE